MNVYYNNLVPPLSPNESEIEIYTQFVNKVKNDNDNENENENENKQNTCLLLGYTKELIHLCDLSMDINPPEISDQKTVRGDWFTINSYYDIIIGDGSINLAGGDLVKHLSQYCGLLVVRFFTEKIPVMKYATKFRINTPFLLPDQIIETQNSCKILIWDFRKGK